MHNAQFHLPTLAQIQEVAKSPGHAEALMAGLMSVAGAGHPASPGVTQSNTEVHQNPLIYSRLIYPLA